MKEKYFIVDRIEGQKIVLEDYKGEIILIDNKEISTSPKEGDVLVRLNDGFEIDSKETENRKKKIEAMMKGMWVD